MANFPRNKQSLEVSYLIIKVTSLWWSFAREYRILSVRRLEALIKHDISQRKLTRLQQLPESMYAATM